ncbi:hypothetical protein NDU88_002055 [Pleurodeles waltl]|uniref:Uncharacterized protein n=1 Tax=Pleurodeles waltl TaxID=8319 RepID=A0AAV7TK47_PLEWA|nr:hypothetical protein NDU88_002055 [Pleurodeles waltl]
MEPELQVFTMLFYAMALMERGADRVGDDKGDAWMDVVEVSASEVCVLHDVVVVAVAAVHAGVSVNVTVREEEEGEKV